MRTRPLMLLGLVLGMALMGGCGGSGGDAPPALPSIDPDKVVRGDDGMGTFPTLNDEVVCHTVGGHLTEWQTPRTYDWDKGGASGALKGNRNRDVQVSELPDLFAMYVSGTAKAYDDRIEFYDYTIDGTNIYSTGSKDASITLNGTLHCTVFIDESGVETPATGAPAPPEPSAEATPEAIPDATPSAGAAVNTPAQAATEYYQSQGRGDFEATCAVTDPQVVAAMGGTCAAGWAQMYEAMPDPELSAFLSTYVVPEEGTTIAGDTAEVVVAPGPKWTTTTTLSMVLREDRWYVAFTFGG